MAPFSRRDFLVSISALAGTSLGFSGSLKVYGQAVGPSDKELDQILRKQIFHKPIPVPQSLIDMGVAQHDAALNDFQAFRDLINLLAAPKDAKHLTKMLGHAIDAVEASKASLPETADTIESKGIPANLDEFLHDGIHADNIMSGPFQNALEKWIANSPEASAAIPASIASDPRFSSLIDRACGGTPYGGGECATTGETFNHISVLLAAGGGGLIIVLIIVLILLLISIWNLNAAGACLSGKLLKATIADDPNVPGTPAEVATIVNGVFAGMAAQGSRRSAADKQAIADWLSDAFFRSPPGPAADRLATLASEVRRAAC